MDAERDASGKMAVTMRAFDWLIAAACHVAVDSLQMATELCLVRHDIRTFGTGDSPYLLMHLLDVTI